MFYAAAQVGTETGFPLELYRCPMLDEEAMKDITEADLEARLAPTHSLAH